jgi:surface polysaccharide O-acyltransferase-like enzyme
MKKLAETPKKNNFYYITVLQVISALAVVLLHANGAFWHYRDTISWQFNNVIESVFYFAVPIFFMITGATLIDYQDRYDTKTFFKRRFLKVLIPFIFWSLFGLFFFGFIRGKSYSLDPLSIYNNIVDNKYVSIFWFFIPLICIYLSIPLFAAVDKEKRIKTFKYLAILGIILNILMPFLVSCFSYAFHRRVALNIEVGVVAGYLIYPVIGYLLHKIDLTKKQRIMIYIAAIIGLLIHIVGTIIVSKHSGHVDKLFKGYLNLPCLLSSVGVFVFFKYHESAKLLQKLKKSITLLAKYTFALYLVHHFVIIQLIDILSPLGIVSTLAIFVPIVFVLASVISIAIIWLIRKLPFGKALLP